MNSMYDSQINMGFSKNKGWAPSMNVNTNQTVQKNHHENDDHKKVCENLVSEIHQFRKPKKKEKEDTKRFRDLNYVERGELEDDYALDMVGKIQGHLSWINSVQRSSSNPNFFG